MSDQEHFHENDHQQEHHHDEHHHAQPDSNAETSTTSQQQQPSAPPAEDNGYEIITEAMSHIKSQVEAASNDLVGDLSNRAHSVAQQAEADSTNEPSKPAAVAAPADSKEKELPKCSSNSDCAICPYYKLACKTVRKIQVPPKVQDLLLWKNPKCTGAVFGSSFILLLSLASFSLLTVIGSLLLLELIAIGAYRFYLALLFRIKGVEDKTFDKLSAYDVSLPKDRVQEIARLLETDINKVLFKLKSILLWENFQTSVLAFVGFYLLYCVGCVFNTLTILILALVALFTLPKVYQVYKQPIDQTLEKTTSAIHRVVMQISVKVPFLNKKKTQ